MEGEHQTWHLADLAILDLKNIFYLEKNQKLLLYIDNRILATLIDGDVRYQKIGFKF
jgi:hypothetical protein